jgi:DNA (cytosine-5)-methyltransferase 1
MRELALFAGAGGGILGGLLLGWRTVCAVELDPYCRSVLLARQRDGMLPRFPVWDDVSTFDGKPWRGVVDVVSGGFPCQDISCAGRGKGITGERSGLWSEFARVIREVGPRYVFVENSPALTSRGLGVVLGDLASMGFDARWGVLGAIHVGAPHRRLRMWIVAHSNSHELWEQSGGRRGKSGPRANEPADDGEAKHVADTNSAGLEIQGYASSDRACGAATPGAAAGCSSEAHDRSAAGAPWWDTEPDVGRVAHGIPNRVDRLRALGNGQVPAVAALAWRVLGGDLT